MKCQIQFSGKNKKNIINLSSAENAQRVVKVKHLWVQSQGHCTQTVCGITNESKVQSTLVISNSKGLSEIIRDIRSSTYQVCRIEGKII